MSAVLAHLELTHGTALTPPWFSSAVRLNTSSLAYVRTPCGGQDSGMRGVRSRGIRLRDACHQGQWHQAWQVATGVLRSRSQRFACQLDRSVSDASLVSRRHQLRLPAKTPPSSTLAASHDPAVINSGCQPRPRHGHEAQPSRRTLRRGRGGNLLDDTGAERLACV